MDYKISQKLVRAWNNKNRGLSESLISHNDASQRVLGIGIRKVGGSIQLRFKREELGKEYISSPIINVRKAGIDQGWHIWEIQTENSTYIVKMDLDRSRELVKVWNKGYHNSPYNNVRLGHLS